MSSLGARQLQDLIAKRSSEERSTAKTLGLFGITYGEDLEKAEAASVGQQRNETYHAHRDWLRHGTHDRVPDDCPDHPQTKQPHGDALGERGYAR